MNGVVHFKNFQSKSRTLLLTREEKKNKWKQLDKYAIVKQQHRKKEKDPNIITWALEPYTGQCIDVNESLDVIDCSHIYVKKIQVLVHTYQIPRPIYTTESKIIEFHRKVSSQISQILPFRWLLRRSYFRQQSQTVISLMVQ